MHALRLLNQEDTGAGKIAASRKSTYLKKTQLKADRNPLLQQHVVSNMEW